MCDSRRAYTSDVTKQLAHEGVKHLAVMCPGFVADCLETLSEIGQELRELFLAHGGEKFTCIPCLNDDALWIQGLVRIVTDELGYEFISRALSYGWLGFCAYTWFAPEMFKSWLKQELGSVKLDPEF